MLAYQGAPSTGASASTHEIKLVTARHPQPVLETATRRPAAEPGGPIANQQEDRMSTRHVDAEVADPRVRRSPEWPHPRGRTGVRFVLTNPTDPSHADDYGAWYDDYESAI